MKRSLLLILILLAILSAGAVSASDNITGDSLTADDIDDSFSDVKTEILESDGDDSPQADKKDPEMKIGFVARDSDGEIYQIDKDTDMVADDYNHDYVWISFPNMVSGNLSFYIDGKSVSNKSITARNHYFFTNNETYGLAAGTHLWEVLYSGDDNYTSASKNGTFALNIKKDSNVTAGFVRQDDDGAVNPIDALTDLHVNDHDSDYIMVKFPSRVTGVLYLYIDGKLMSEKQITARTHYFYANTKSYKLGEGNHTWKIRYSGDGNYSYEVLNGTYVLNPKSDTFVKKDSKMNVYVVTKDADSLVYAIDENRDLSLKNTNTDYFKVKFKKDVSGTLYLYIDGALKSTKAIKAKTHYFFVNAENYNLNAGKHTWKIVYSGDDEYNSTYDEGEFTLNAVESKVKSKKMDTTLTASKTKNFKASAKVKKYAVTLKANKKPLKKVKVYLTVKGKKYKKTFSAKTNSKGKAIFKIKKLTRKGKYSAKITYKGSKAYKSIGKKVTIKVSKNKCKITAGKAVRNKKEDYDVIRALLGDLSGFIDVDDAYAYLNQFRTENGVWQWDKGDSTKTVFNTDASNTLDTLERDTELEYVAMLRAKEICQNWNEKHILTHTRPDGSSYDTVYPTSKMWAWGENIALGYQTCKDVTEAWKETKDLYDGQGHRRNMLNSKFNCVGIAGYKVNGITYWVQSFGCK